VAQLGFYRPNGEIRSGLIDEIADQIPVENLLFEAPQKVQQVWFIKKFGSNVNLGNIMPSEVISVETLRLGLRR
jgi:phosphosulfolactate synthase